MKVFFLNQKPIQLIFASMLVVSTLFVSCDKDDDDNMDKTYTLSGSASGSQMSPSNTSTATGTLTGTYDASTNLFQYNINWNGLAKTASIVEVHGPAAVGANGSLLFPLTITAPGVNGTASGSVTLTNDQETSLLAGNTYYTILNTNFPSGEIRGQITASAQ